MPDGRRSFPGGGHYPPNVLRREEHLARREPLDGQVEPARRLGVPPERGAQRTLLGRYGGEPRALEVHAIVGKGSLVAPTLELLEGVLNVTPPRQAVVDRVRDQLRIAERVADSERKVRILVGPGSELGHAMNTANRLSFVGNAKHTRPWRS